jgi:hypothetical protein
MKPEFRKWFMKDVYLTDIFCNQVSIDCRQER